MLNQFYKYLADKLIGFFNESNLNGGERFYLQFDNKAQVNSFYHFLKEDSHAQEFQYQHNQGSPYLTFALLVDDIKVVIAATNENVTPDFLVTLRNQVGEQKNEWKKTALLSICHETLDSIRGGSSDLQKEGMPLNVKSILKTLEEEIDKNDTLSRDHKEILKFHLRKKKEEAFIQTSLWDYEEILGFLSQGEIKRVDYSHLGLFYDSNLDQFSKNQMKSRLEDNYSLFQQVQHIHEYENLQNQLEKLFDDKGIQTLKKENWQESEYGAIKSSHENSLQGDKPIEYIETKKSMTSDGLLFWEKPQIETKSGQRKRHIIVFNPQRVSKIQLSFEFKDRLRKEFIHKKSASFCTVSGKNFQLGLDHKSNTSSFFQAVYTHNNQTNSKYIFNIAIVECERSLFESVKTLFEVNVKEKRIILNRKNENILFGDIDSSDEEVLVEEENQVIQLQDNGVKISIESPAWDDDNLFFQLLVNESLIPLMIKEEISRITPISGMRIWKLKREKGENFYYDDIANKLKQNTREFSASKEMKKYLLDEINWVNKGFHFAIRTAVDLEGQTLALNNELLKAYTELLQYYQNEKLVPSLANMNEYLATLSIRFITEYIECIAKIKEDSILDNETKNLFKLGTIQEVEKVLYTPLHPLNIAYQLEIQNRLQDESIDMHILERLTPNNLLPYIYGEKNQVYRPISQKEAPEWLVYETLQKVAIGESNAFLSNVVEEKLNQFVEHFPFLFLSNAKSPIKLNVINITNDHEVVRGLINFLKKQIEKKGPFEIVPIEIAIYDNQEKSSAFEKFSLVEEAEELEQIFNVSLTTKKLDAVDVLRIIRENILYYRRSYHKSYGYAHISFYKMVSNDTPATNKMKEIETGLSLKGLFSSQSYLKTKNDYRTGFGIKHAENQSNNLITVAKSLNELASNLVNEGVNPYHKDEAIVTRTANYDEEILNQLYEASYWVTFIEPNVDLDFFQNSSRNLLVIHYSDQYSSSTQYDAITVTDKSSQYKSIIEQYLNSREIQASPAQIETAIRAFNSFNGEWLLRIIGSKGQFSREKLSIISAIKFVLSALDHNDIFWVPVSLEEILRIAGATKLTKNEGVFSAKNLNANGVHSDDLLLIGVELRAEEVFVHYFPVEVKLGINQNVVISKAKEQINKTHYLFETQLAKQDSDGNAIFKNEFFRNFFIQILLSNAEKLIENRIWKEKDYAMIYTVKEKLLNDNYQLTYHLKHFIGKGAVLSFKKEQTWKSVKVEEDILIIELTEEDGYTGVITEIEDLKDSIQKGSTDIDPAKLLFNKYQYIREESNAEISLAGQQISNQLKENENDTDNVKNNFVNDAFTKTLTINSDDIRVLLGSIEGSTKEIFWEYGHPGLANRHLLISGKSGQGKSYFIQCVLLELSRQGISNIIFDYTDGFKNSKLEPKFKELMGENLEQFLVALNKFPINPFKRNKKELDEEIYIDEDDTDIAERIKGVFSSVFKDLGIQQQNAIYESVLRGLNKYGDSMDLELLLAELEEDKSGPAKTARSQIKPLIDKSPFRSDANYDWQQLINQKGKVFIIQLTGYNREVQMMITEFILWDLWNHLLNHGDKKHPLTVILDEAQNLDHREKSPSAKILTEGRKFGWSGCYATQSFRGQFTIDEVSRLQGASQKIYFMPPENEISSIASNITQDAQKRREWEKKLSTLKKGQCVVSGPMLQEDGTLVQSPPMTINISPLEDRTN